VSKDRFGSHLIIVKSPGPSLAQARANPDWSTAMHPILSELFTKPVGWMTLGGIAFMIGLGFYLWWFARREIRKETCDD
jgi:Protein of unknown function (DUF3149)